MSKVVAQQFFGTFLTMQNSNEWWLINGLASFYSGLYIKKLFGNNEYKYMIYKKMKDVCAFERDQGQIVLDFNYSGQVMGGFKENLNKTPSSQFSHRYHLMGSQNFFSLAEKKAHLVIRLIEDCIGHDVTLQLINKMFNLAINSINEKTYWAKCWQPFLISIESFLALLGAFSSKDIKHLLDLWVYKPGIAKLQGSFTFNRKKNAIEIEVKQDMANQRGYRKYVGPVTIVIQEIDGPFTHIVQIEDSISTKFEINCHSKGKKNKKKKIPLIDRKSTRLNSSHSVKR